MAVHIRLIKNNIKSSSSYGKYFAKTVSQGEVTLGEIAAEACRNSGFSEGTVDGVVTELQGQVSNLDTASTARSISEICCKDTKQSELHKMCSR